MTIFEDLDCWPNPNTQKPGFDEIKHHLTNFSNLSPVPRLKFVNGKIKIFHLENGLKNNKQNFQTNILKYQDTLLVRTFG